MERSRKYSKRKKKNNKRYFSIDIFARQHLHRSVSGADHPNIREYINTLYKTTEERRVWEDAHVCRMGTEEQVGDIRAKVSNISAKFPDCSAGEEQNNRLSEGGIREHPRYLYDSLCNGYSDIRNEGEFMFSNNDISSSRWKCVENGERIEDLIYGSCRFKWKRI